MQLAGGNADLCPHAEFSAVGELGRAVVDDDAGIDLAQELLGGGGIPCDDRLGMARAVGLDVADRLVVTCQELLTVDAARTLIARPKAENAEPATNDR